MQLYKHVFLPSVLNLSYYCYSLRFNVKCKIPTPRFHINESVMIYGEFYPTILVTWPSILRPCQIKLNVYADVSCIDFRF